MAACTPSFRFTASVADLVVLAFVPTVRFNPHGLLFGDILAVSRTDLAIIIWGGGAVALVLFVVTRIRRPRAA